MHYPVYHSLYNRLILWPFLVVNRLFEVQFVSVIDVFVIYYNFMITLLHSFIHFFISSNQFQVPFSFR